MEAVQEKKGTEQKNKKKVIRNSFGFPLPEGVQARVEGSKLIVKGPKGEISKDFFLNRVSIKILDSGKVFIKADSETKVGKRMSRTAAAHVKNMLHGVKDGVTYKLKICASHFPISADIKNNELTVKNFIGEKRPRKLKLKQGVAGKVEGDIIVLQGVDKELVGTAASDIEKLCKRPDFDNRIFQDGIYIIEKQGQKK